MIYEIEKHSVKAGDDKEKPEYVIWVRDDYSRSIILFSSWNKPTIEKSNSDSLDFRTKDGENVHIWIYYGDKIKFKDNTGDNEKLEE